MESDDRFKHLASDPRFKTLKRKQRKVQIDDRFKSMFTDKKFTLKYTRDKRGNAQKKNSADDLKRYYSLEEKESEPKKSPAEEDEEEEEEEDDASVEQISSEEQADEGSEVDEDEDVDAEEDEEEEDEEEDQESLKEQTTSDSELSSSSDESESEVSEAEDDELAVNKIEYDWQPLDHDAETAEVTTRRLAIQNLDWDHLDVKDIYTLVHSIRPPKSVKIYVSEFGKERLRDEELHGPKEIIEMPKVDEEEEEFNMIQRKMDTFQKSRETKSYTINSYEDADEEMDPKNEEIRERIRRYQLNRMKYYYAVVEFDSVDSAETVYKELDGHEYEGSSLELDLRFIPDDIEFEDCDLKSECNKVPDLSSYEAPQFINSAIQQTTVKFTWDETDVKRQANLHKAYTKHELDKDDLDAYLGSGTDSEQEEEEDFGGEDGQDGQREAAAKNKYKLLLESLEAEEEKKKKVDVDVEWTDNDEEEEVDEEGEEEESESESESGDEDEQKDQLELLVSDPAALEKGADNFEFNPDDDRFKAVYESGVYNIDPSHPNFKRTEAFDKIAERKRVKRQRTKDVS